MPTPLRVSTMKLTVIAIAHQVALTGCVAACRSGWLCMYPISARHDSKRENDADECYVRVESFGLLL